MHDLLFSTLRLSTPLLFAAAGGLLCERSGVATICLEGAMLVAAFAAATTDVYTGSPGLSLLVGILAGALMMSMHAILSLYAKADHIISGVAVNLMAAGLTPLFCKILFGSATNTPSIALENRLHGATIIGLGLVVLFLLHFFFKKTAWGLWVHSAGDGPEALETAGVSPRRVRTIALLLGGALAGIGGVYLSISHASGFTRDMTAGRGFIALTALIFGKWKPLNTFFACLFFGLADALQIQFQSTTIFGHEFPVQFIQALPYLLTLFVLVSFVGRARPPAAIGK